MLASLCLFAFACVMLCVCFDVLVIFFMSCACVSLVVGCHLSASFYLLVVSSFFILNVGDICYFYLWLCHVIRLLSCACVCCFVVLVSL